MQDPPIRAAEQAPEHTENEGSAVPRRCGGTNGDGSPCNSPFVLPSGFCISHDPDKEHERKAAQQRGGMRTASRKRKGLNPADLPPLETLEDAQKWSAVIAKAVATGFSPFLFREAVRIPPRCCAALRDRKSVV